MIKYREKIYAAIIAAGDWVNLDELVVTVGLNRRDLSNQLTQMLTHKDYPRLHRDSKRSSGKCKFGTTKAIYDIKYKYEVK